MRNSRNSFKRPDEVNALKFLYKIWMTIALFIGRVNTAILLTLFYFLFLGIAKVAALLTGKDLLDERWKDRPSYWKKREKLPVDRVSFLKPY